MLKHQRRFLSIKGTLCLDNFFKTIHISENSYRFANFAG